MLKHVSHRCAPEPELRLEVALTLPDPHPLVHAREVFFVDRLRLPGLEVVTLRRIDVQVCDPAILSDPNDWKVDGESTLCPNGCCEACRPELDRVVLLVS